jgi:uncharacterized protein (DUF305 family)
MGSFDRSSRVRARPLGLLIALGLTGAVLVGCGAASGAQNPTIQRTQYTAEERKGHNQIDVDFAQMMLVHTRQSIALADLAKERSAQPEVLALAAELAGSDAETLDDMTALLDEWGADVPDEIALDEMDHSNMEHAGIGMGFMAGISDDQVTLLGSLGADEFDKRFLRFMLIHRGAGVAMAQSEKIYGQSGTATRIAKGLESEQAAEMQTIQDLQHPD